MRAQLRLVIDECDCHCRCSASNGVAEKCVRGTATFGHRAVEGSYLGAVSEPGNTRVR
jgi:hypothetical protein